MKFGRLGGLNTFSIYDIFNLQWVYRDGGLPTWLSGKESACQSMGWEDLLEKEIATHSRGAWQATVHGGHKRAGHDLVTK